MTDNIFTFAGTHKPILPTRLAIRASWIACSLLMVAGGSAVHAGQFAPYSVDPDTLHLWHLDESSSPAADEVAGADNLPLAGQLNGAVFGSASLAGFGTALQPNANPNQSGLLLAASALASGTGDNVAFTHADPVTGAFTFEAIIKFDAGYDPVTATDGSIMEIISMDGDTLADRVFQFRYYGQTSGGNPKIQFANLRTSPAVTMAVDVPLSGIHAVNNTDWFHVAVSYDGNEGAANNLKFYWTRLQGDLFQAALLGTATMAQDLQVVSGDFAIGNEARNTPSEGWIGLIDEVRISRVARAATDFLISFEDVDGDGLPDSWEQQIIDANPSDTITSINDVLPDGDFDGDTFSNIDEFEGGTDPTVYNDPNDLDGDGLPDSWEVTYFGSSASQDATGDPDRDGYDNLLEYDATSNPTNPNSVPDDVDGDNLADDWELANFLDLSHSAYEDADLDEYSNLAEMVAGTNPLSAGDHPVWQSPRVAFLRDSAPATNAYLAVATAPFGRTINGVSFQDKILHTFEGYQYSAWYDLEGDTQTICLARRTVSDTSVGSWEVFKTDSQLLLGKSDAHNVISFGICPADGTLHFAWDLHGDPLRYRRSVVGLCTTNKAAWGAGMLGPERSVLSGDDPVNYDDWVTYPQFIATPDGGLMLVRRYGSSTNGDQLLQTYDPGTGTWNANTKYISKSGVYQTASARNAYLNGIDFGPNGDIHVTWTWRENLPFAGVTASVNHDINYAYSEDNGITWRNNEGLIIADTTLGETITINSPGIVIRPLDQYQLLVNQQSQCVDNDGRLHVLMLHRRQDPGFEYPNVTTQRFSARGTAYYHYYRDPATREWQERRLPVDAYPVGSRPKICFDAKGNVYAAYVSYADDPDITPGRGNGMLVVASASQASQYTDWEVVQSIPVQFGGEPLIDQARLLADNILSVYIQEHSELTEAVGTPLHVFDFVVDVPVLYSLGLSFLGEDALVTLPASVGQVYRLQASSSLSPAQWEDIGPAVTGFGGLLALPEPGARQETHRFYRVAIDP